MLMLILGLGFTLLGGYLAREGNWKRKE